MLLLDGQVHHDTHVIPMGNYVSGVGNYVSVSPSGLGNYVSADTTSRAVFVSEAEREGLSCPAEAACVPFQFRPACRRSCCSRRRLAMLMAGVA